MIKLFKFSFILILPALIMFVLVSCEDTEDRLTGSNPTGNTVDVSNRISGFTPAIAGAGTPLTINGSSLSGVKRIYMGSTWIFDFEASDSEITFNVPGNMTLGANEITLVFDGDERAINSVEVVPIPSINYFTPKAAGEGDEVIITGNNLSYANSVTVSGVSATITEQEDGLIRFTMPGGATTGPIEVTNSSGNVSTSPGSIISCSDEPDNLACFPVINVNGSFEDGETNWNLAGGSSAATHTYEVTDEDSYDGFYSAKITVESVSEAASDPNEGSAWHIQPTTAMNVDPTATYHVSFWVKGSGLAKAKFAMDQGGTPGWSEWAAPTSGIATDEWTEFTYEFSPTTEAPPGDQSSRFAISMNYPGNNGGVLYIDNLRVVKID